MNELSLGNNDRESESAEDNVGRNAEDTRLAVRSMNELSLGNNDRENEGAEDNVGRNAEDTRLAVRSMNELSLGNNDRENESAEDNVGPNVEKSRFSIALMHGLEGAPDNFYRVRNILEDVYPKAKIIPLHEEDTCGSPMEDQVNRAFEALFTKIKSCALQEAPLVVIGHSQGGLRAHKMLQRYGNQLTMGPKRLVTISTPWLGSPMLRKEESLSGAVKWLANSRIGEFSPVLKKVAGRKLAESPGIRDLHPDSAFVSEIRNAIENPNLRPEHLKDKHTLVLASHLDPNSRVRYFIAGVGWLKGVNTLAYMQEMHGSDEHDLISPVNTQLGKGLLDDLVQSRTIRGNVIHNTNVEKNYLIRRRIGLTGVLERNDVIEEIVEFINTELGVQGSIDWNHFYTPSECAVL